MGSAAPDGGSPIYPSCGHPRYQSILDDSTSMQCDAILLILDATPEDTTSHRLGHTTDCRGTTLQLTAKLSLPESSTEDRMNSSAWLSNSLVQHRSRIKFAGTWQKSTSAVRSTRPTDKDASCGSRGIK